MQMIVVQEFRILKQEKNQDVMDVQIKNNAAVEN